MININANDEHYEFLQIFGRKDSSVYGTKGMSEHEDDRYLV